MLTSARIQNYRCLRDVTLELGPLTVLSVQMLLEKLRSQAV